MTLHYLPNSLHDISMFYSQDRHFSRLSEHFIPEIIVGVGPSKRRKGQTHAVRWILKTCWYCDSWIPGKLYRSITHTHFLILKSLARVIYSNHKPTSNLVILRSSYENITLHLIWHARKYSVQMKCHNYFKLSLKSILSIPGNLIAQIWYFTMFPTEH